MTHKNQKLADAWKFAEETPGEAVDIGRIVVCDVCDDDYTDSMECGGFIFSSTAYCPKCAPKGLATIAKYHEERFIKARCATDQTFADFVRLYRGQNGKILITEIKRP